MSASVNLGSLLRSMYDAASQKQVSKTDQSSTVTTTGSASSSSVSEPSDTVTLSAVALAHMQSHSSTGNSLEAVSVSTLSITATIQPNALRLSQAESNLSQLESTSTTSQLASAWNKAVASSVDLAGEPAADAQIANLPSTDPDHISQASATQKYVKNRIANASSGNFGAVANPFAGMSQNSLSAIVSDKSGLYTDYEKTAAMYASTDQTNSWVMQYASKDQGTYKGFFEEAASQYKDLSPLQQSVYPPDYLQTLKREASWQQSGTSQYKGRSHSEDMLSRLFKEVKAHYHESDLIAAFNETRAADKSSAFFTQNDDEFYNGRGSALDKISV